MNTELIQSMRIDVFHHSTFDRTPKRTNKHSANGIKGVRLN